MNKKPNKPGSHLHFASSADNSPEALMQQAIAALENGKLEVAEEQLVRIARDFPDIWQVHQALASLYAEQERWDEAFASIKTFLTHQPDDIMAYRLLTFAAEQIGDYDEALRAVDEVLKREPDDLDAYFIRAEFSTSAGNVEQALADFQHILTVDPDSIDARTGIARVLLLFTDRQQEAETIAREAVRLDEKDVPARIFLGQALAMQTRYDDALTEYRVALKLDPKNAVIHYQMGSVYEELADLTAAKKAYDAALRLNPEPAEFHRDILLHVGQMFLDQENPVTAIEYLERALEVDVEFENPELFLDLGDAYLQVGRVGEACEVLESGVDLDPENPDLHLQLAVAYRASDKLANAVTALRQAIELDPDFMEAYGELGFVLLGLERYKEAREAFRHILTAEPLNVQALSGLAMVAIGQQKPDEALKLARKVEEIEPAFIFGRYALIAALLANNDRPAADAIYQELAAKDPELGERAQLLFSSFSPKE